jgi:hypothetical protein
VHRLYISFSNLSIYLMAAYKFLFRIPSRSTVPMSNWIPDAVRDSLRYGRTMATNETANITARVVLGILIVTVVTDIVYSVWFHPLAHIPGPRFAKLSQFARMFRFLPGKEHLEDARLFEKYGV